jgi:hypothetical protein
MTDKTISRLSMTTDRGCTEDEQETEQESLRSVLELRLRGGAPASAGSGTNAGNRVKLRREVSRLPPVPG